MENAFLRDSWNKRLTKQEFIRTVNEQFDLNSISTLISLLENICSIQNPAPLFFEYFGSIVEYHLAQSLANVDFLNDAHIISYFNLMKNNSGTLFDHCNIGQKEDAHAALNALRICLIQCQKSVISPIILKLIRSSNFLILIASARIFDSDNFLLVRKIYNDVKPFESYPIPYPLLLQSFTHAFIDESASYQQILLNERDAVVFSSRFLHTFILYDFFPKMFSRTFLFNALIIYLNSFYKHPILSNGIAIHRVIHKICGKSENISKEDLKQLIEEPDYNNECMPKIPFSRNLDVLYDYLFVPRTNFDEDDFLANFYYSPALCPKFTDMVIERIPTGSYKFYDDLMGSVDAFCAFYFENKVNKLLSALIVHLQSIKKAEYFEKVFLFFCSVFILAWNLFNQDDVETFMNDQTQDVQLILKAISCLEIENKGSAFPIPIFVKPAGLPMPKIDTTTPFEKCVKFISDVKMMGSEEVFDRVNKDRFLFMLALSEGVKHQRKDFTILAKVKFPDMMILNHRFRQMLSIVLQEKPQWQNFIENMYASYDVMKMYPPPSISDVEHYLLKDLYFCFGYIETTLLDIFMISIRWSLWFQLFGVKEMMTMIFKLLSKGEFVSVMNQPYLYLCISGICLTIASKKPGLNMQILRTILELFEEGFEFDNLLISRFFFILFVSVNDEEAHFIFSYIYKMKEGLNSREEVKKKTLLECIATFFKLVMYTPSMLKYLKDDIYQTFMQAGDSAALIDYFILLGKK